MDWLKQNRWGVFAAGAAAFVLLLVAAGMVNAAQADGIAKKGKVAAAAPPTRTWTGIYLGGFGTYETGEVTFGGPVGFSSTGPAAGVNVGVNVQTGQLVWGAEVAHAWMFGNLKDIGLEREIEYTGRLGVLLNSQTLLYGHGSFVQLHTDFVGSIEGWKFGPGVEIRMPTEGWSIDLRGGYAIYDIESIAPPGFDANALWLRAGLVKRFDMPAGWFGQ